METAVQKLIDLVQQLAPELWHIGRLSVVTQVAEGFANYLIFTIAMVALYVWLGKSMPVGKVDDMTHEMPLLRIITNRFMSLIISAFARQYIPDTQCGFRLVKKEVLQKITLSTSKYETESEILIKAARLGFKIEFVPIKTIYSGQKSQINPFVDTLRFLRFITLEFARGFKHN